MMWLIVLFLLLFLWHLARAPRPHQGESDTLVIRPPKWFIWLHWLSVASGLTGAVTVPAIMAREPNPLSIEILIGIVAICLYLALISKMLIPHWTIRVTGEGAYFMMRHVRWSEVKAAARKNGGIELHRRGRWKPKVYLGHAPLLQRMDQEVAAKIEAIWRENASP